MKFMALGEIEDFEELLKDSEEQFRDLVSQYLKLRKEHWELLSENDRLKRLLNIHEL